LYGWALENAEVSVCCHSTSSAPHYLKSAYLLYDMSEGGVLIPYDHSSPYNPDRYPVLLGGTDPGQRKSRHHTGEYFRANEVYSSVTEVSCEEDKRDTKLWPVKLVQSLGIEIPIESPHQALPKDLLFTRDPSVHQ
jgi:hypothetical protein